MSEPKRLSAERLAWLLPLPTELRNHIDAIEAELAAAKAQEAARRFDNLDASRKQ